VASLAWLLALAAAAYGLFLLYLRLGVGFELLNSDALSYWKLSFTLGTAYNTWWVPGYPATIALLRALTLDSVSAVALMVTIAGTSYLVSVGTVYRLAQELEIDPAVGVALLFAVYPFVGLTFSVYPVADSMATALLALCLLHYARQRWVHCAVYFGLMILTHKATWFFALPLLALGFATKPRSRVPLVIAALPLLGLIVAGTLHYRHVLWFVQGSVENVLTSQSSLPIVPGITGSLLAGGVAKIAKGLIALAIFLIGGAMLVPSCRRGFGIGVAIAVALLLMGAVLDEEQIWALVRFSKVLVVPLAWLVLRGFSGQSPGARAAWASVLLASLGSNMAFGYYMAKGP
jgi:hypothetical protein